MFAKRSVGHEPSAPLRGGTGVRERVAISDNSLGKVFCVKDRPHQWPLRNRQDYDRPSCRSTPGRQHVLRSGEHRLLSPLLLGSESGTGRLSGSLNLASSHGRYCAAHSRGIRDRPGHPDVHLAARLLYEDDDRTAGTQCAAVLLSSDPFQRSPQRQDFWPARCRRRPRSG